MKRYIAVHRLEADAPYRRETTCTFLHHTRADAEAEYPAADLLHVVEVDLSEGTPPVTEEPKP